MADSIKGSFVVHKKGGGQNKNNGKVGENITTLQQNNEKRKNKLENLERKIRSQKGKQRVGKSVIADMYQQANPFSSSKSLPSSKD